MRSTAALATAAVLVLGGCGSDTTAPVGDGPAPTLDGRTFVGDQVDGHALVPGSSLRLAFQDGQLSIDAGCNHLGAPAHLDHGRLVVGPVGGTEMGCSNALMDQDAWLSSFLGTGPDASVDASTLVLSHRGVRITLRDQERVRAADPIPLRGTTWTLESLFSGPGDNGSASNVSGPKPTLRIVGDQVQVFTGCNRGSGKVAVGDTTLTVSDLALTLVGCLHSPEPDVLRVLDSRPSYAQDYDVLTLTTPDGEHGLQFRAAS
jgi:heat shock protein HslJ